MDVDEKLARVKLRSQKAAKRQHKTETRRMIVLPMPDALHVAEATVEPFQGDTLVPFEADGGNAGDTLVPFEADGGNAGDPMLVMMRVMMSLFSDLHTKHTEHTDLIIKSFKPPEPPAQTQSWPWMRRIGMLLLYAMLTSGPVLVFFTGSPTSTDPSGLQQYIRFVIDCVESVSKHFWIISLVFWQVCILYETKYDKGAIFHFVYTHAIAICFLTRGIILLAALSHPCLLETKGGDCISYTEHHKKSGAPAGLARKCGVPDAMTEVCDRENKGHLYGIWLLKTFGKLVTCSDSFMQQNLSDFVLEPEQATESDYCPLHTSKVMDAWHQCYEHASLDAFALATAIATCVLFVWFSICMHYRENIDDHLASAMHGCRPLRTISHTCTALLYCNVYTVITSEGLKCLCVRIVYLVYSMAMQLMQHYAVVSSWVQQNDAQTVCLLLSVGFFVAFVCVTPPRQAMRAVHVFPRTVVLPYLVLGYVAPTAADPRSWQDVADMFEDTSLFNPTDVANFVNQFDMDPRPSEPNAKAQIEAAHYEFMLQALVMCFLYGGLFLFTKLDIGKKYKKMQGPIIWVLMLSLMAVGLLMFVHDKCHLFLSKFIGQALAQWMLMYFKWYEPIVCLPLNLCTIPFVIIWGKGIWRIWHESCTKVQADVADAGDAEDADDAGGAADADDAGGAADVPSSLRQLISRDANARAVVRQIELLTPSHGAE